MDVHTSRLKISGSRVRYFVKMAAVLRSPSGRMIVHHDVEAAAKSRFDKRTVPPAVWQALCTVADEAIGQIARDPKTHISVNAWRAGQKK